MGRLIALLAALVLGALMAWAGERVPEPKGAEAPVTEFSASRAMRDVDVIASVPHPVGSPENKRVRDHLTARMTELGLSPQVRPGVGVLVPDRAPGVVIGGAIENVIGVLPGRDRSQPALALMAHYDSVPGSPGAADDAAGTAAALEIVRALKARGQPARDVMLVITDGEEAGLVGANAFFRRDPDARRVGLVLNLETRGGAGRTQMFQTSPDNGGLIDLLRRTAVRPASSSLAVFIYENLPNDTDLTETLRAGIPGMNYAFIGSQFDYHSATSTPANLDKGALQDLGQQVLATAGEAAFAPALPGPAPPVVYSQVFGDLILAYPGWVGWPILLACAALIFIAARQGRELEPFPWTDVARGAGALLFAVVGAAALLQFARHATGAEVGYLQQRFLLAQAHRWEAATMLLGLGFLLLAAAELARGRRVVAVVPLAAGVACSAFGGFDPVGLGAGIAAALLAVLAFGRTVSRPGAWTGVLLVGLGLAIVVQALAPAAALVFAWPLLAASLAAALTAAGARRGVVGQVVLAVLAALTLGWLGSLAHGAFISMDMVPLMALPLLLAGLVLWPLAQVADGAPPERWIGMMAVLAGLGVTAWVRLADPYDARYPQATSVSYHLDLDARRGRLVSTTPDLPAWSELALKAQGGPVQRIPYWAFSGKPRAVAAPFADAPGPVTTLTRRGDRTLSLRVAPPPGGLTVAVRLRPDRPLTLESVGGVATPMTLAPGDWTLIRWVGSGDGTELVLRPTGPGVLTVRSAATVPGWPKAAKPLPPRPADVMAWDVSDATVVSQTHSYAW